MKHLKIRELKSILDKAVENLGDNEKCDPEIEVYFKKSAYAIEQVTQSGVLGTLYVVIGEKVYDGETE